MEMPKAGSIVLAVGLLFLGSTASARTWYVNQAATGTETGRSWQNAATTIQDAIDAAAAGDQIWIAQGTYNERRENKGSLLLKNGLSLYGGFRGGETDRDARDSQACPTIIDGSTARNSFPAYHVITGAQNVLLDGFTITGGYATGQDFHGGGFLQQGPAILRRCIFHDNKATASGGAIHNELGSLELSACVFRGNRSEGGNGGGALFAHGATVQAEFCRFEDNTTTSDGGAICIMNATALWKQCAFVRNHAPEGNGAVLAYQVEGTLINVLFSGNVTRGGTLHIKLGHIEAVNCCWSGNHGQFGAIRNFDAQLGIANSIFWGNNGPQINGAAAVSYSVVQGGHPGDHIIDKDPLFADPAQDDCRLLQGSPCIDAGTVEGAPSTDFQGNPRPIDAGIDIGPYEGAADAAVKFQAHPSVGAKPLAVSFNSTLAPALQQNANLFWDFGDTTSSTARNPVHVYEQEGVYDVSLVVTSADDVYAATIHKCVHVYPAMPAPGCAAQVTCAILLMAAAVRACQWPQHRRKD